MKQIILILTVSIILSGCVITQKVAQPEQILPVLSEAEFEETKAPAELQNINDEELEDYAANNGVIFAKTEFQGLLETRYVQFLFEDQDDPKHKFHIHIGEKSGQKKFPWDVKTVQPGYFFVELPAGRYKIAEVTIPVGTATATEMMKVFLEVIPSKITYVGTLKMVGTKEKLKLGGVPVIKPGFEFTVEVIDEREEGAAAFSQNYPNFPHGVSIKLMEVNENPIDEKKPAEEKT